MKKIVKLFIATFIFVLPVLFSSCTAYNSAIKVSDKKAYVVGFQNILGFHFGKVWEMDLETGKVK